MVGYRISKSWSGSLFRQRLCRSSKEASFRRLGEDGPCFKVGERTQPRQSIRNGSKFQELELMIMQGISCCILVSRVALSNPTPSRIGVIKSEMIRSGAGPSARRSNPWRGIFTDCKAGFRSLGAYGRSVSCASGEKARVLISNVTIRPAKPDAAKIMATMIN